MTQSGFLTCFDGQALITSGGPLTSQTSDDGNLAETSSHGLGLKLSKSYTAYPEDR